MYSEHIKIALILSIAGITLLLNLPFGYLRSRARKFSWKWFLYVHLSIPIVFFMRVSSHLSYKVIPVFIIAAVCGQVFGGRIRV